VLHLIDTHDRKDRSWPVIQRWDTRFGSSCRNVRLVCSPLNACRKWDKLHSILSKNCSTTKRRIVSGWTILLKTSRRINGITICPVRNCCFHRLGSHLIYENTLSGSHTRAIFISVSNFKWKENFIPFSTYVVEFEEIILCTRSLLSYSLVTHQMIRIEVRLTP
jgi:hypothetical protein